MCKREDALVYILGAPSIDDVMSYNSLTTLISIEGVLFIEILATTNLFNKHFFTSSSDPSRREGLSSVPSGQEERTGQPERSLRHP